MIKLGAMIMFKVRRRIGRSTFDRTGKGFMYPL